MKRQIMIIIALAFVLPASGHAWDIGQAISSGIGGIQQIAEASKEITPAEEHYIGRAVAAQVLTQYKLLNNAALTDYVNKIGGLLAAVSERPQTYGGYHFAVLDSDEPNAFACPGGIIFVNKGLLKMIKNEDQLAEVLGHEIIHVAYRHAIGELKKAQWTKLGFYAAAEVGKQYSATEVGAIVNQFQGVVSDVSQKVLQAGYSRGDEKAADETGLKLAYAVGYNPAESVEFFKELEKLDLGTSSSAFADHPKVQARIKNLEGEVSSLGGGGTTEQVRTNRYKTATASLR